MATRLIKSLFILALVAIISVGLTIVALSYGILKLDRAETVTFKNYTSSTFLPEFPRNYSSILGHSYNDVGHTFPRLFSKHWWTVFVSVVHLMAWCSIIEFCSRTYKNNMVYNTQNRSCWIISASVKCKDAQWKYMVTCPSEGNEEKYNIPALVKNQARPNPTWGVPWKQVLQCYMFGSWTFASMAGQMDVAAFPVSRFLPDPTRDPSIDLAHVGYRLATLSALPTAVPISRIRLADAGFFSNGRGDEVVCYRCGARHSGWRRGDNPLEVHRRLYPQCQHMAEWDREQAALGRGTGVAGGRGGQTSRTSNSTGGDLAGAMHSGSINIGITAPDPETATSDPRNSSRNPVPVTTPSNIRVENGGVPLSSASQATPPQTTARAAVASQSSSGGSGGDRQRPGPVDSGVRADGHSGGGSASYGPNAVVSTSSASSQPAQEHRQSSNGNDPPSAPDSRSLYPQARLDLGNAVYPMYQDMQSRRRSFSSWDESRAPPLENIIMCGMFYAGYADCVRCFYCGVGLKHWVPTDEPWTEHVRWRPGCEYMRAVKGDDFIRDTQSRLALQGPRTADPQRNIQAAPPAQQANIARAPTANALTTTTTSITSTTTTTAASAAATNVNQGATEVSTTSSSSGSNAGNSGGARGGGSRVVDSVEEDAERLAQLQAENAQLAQRFRCRVCHNAAIDTILMPCGHLVCCESCGRSATNCPLCHDTIRATARVHMA